MFVQASARGAYAFDEEGRRYVDYIMAYGPLLFGHTHPALVTGLDELARGGFVWGSTHAQEVRLAERIRAYLPSMERMRFVTTGTEAVMSAVRVARAFTGRPRILKCAGCYHGHFDLALLEAGASAGDARSGIPEGVARDAIAARYNDLAAVDEAAHGVEHELAAIIVEPIAGNMGFVAPAAGFLEGLRTRAQRWGALLIFDEVITWLRFGLKGAQGRTGIAPDLTALGKIMGGGLPFAVTQQASVVDFKFRPGGPNRNYDDARSADKRAYASYYRAMLARGVLLPPSQNEVMFVSVAHGENDVDATLAAADESLGCLDGAQRPVAQQA